MSETRPDICNYLEVEWAGPAGYDADVENWRDAYSDTENPYALNLADYHDVDAWVRNCAATPYSGFERPPRELASYSIPQSNDGMNSPNSVATHMGGQL